MRIILDLDIPRQCALNRVADIAVEHGIAVIPTGIYPGGQRLLVIVPVVVEGNTIFNRYPAIIIVHNISLLYGKKSKRFKQGPPPMKAFLSHARTRRNKCLSSAATGSFGCRHSRLIQHVRSAGNSRATHKIVISRDRSHEAAVGNCRANRITARRWKLAEAECC